MSPVVKRILKIVIVSLLILGFLLLLWLWYSNKQKSQDQANSGNGNTSNSTLVGTNKNQTISGYSTQIPVTGGVTKTLSKNNSGNSLATNGNLASNNTAGGTGTGGGTGGGTGTGGTGNNTSPTGATWINTPFNPTPITGINGSNPTGTGGNFFGGGSSGGTGTGGGGGNSGLLIGAAASAVACTPGLFGPVAAGTAASAAAIAANAATAVPSSDKVTETYTGAIAATKTSDTYKGFLDCITRQLAKVAMQQITVSVVNWVNSGFHGSPTFIQNYGQFFSNVANNAAGAYIQGSSLAFLCSPFSLQVKIAVAQSYADSQKGASSGGGGASCTLNQVSSNIDSFLKGNFSAGGWPAFLSFTSMPANNPFGAYLIASGQLQSSVLKAQENAAKNISPEGFLNIQQVNCPNLSAAGSACISNNAGEQSIESPVNGQCRPGFSPSSAVVNSSNRIALSANGNVACPAGCDCQTTTPGHVIAATLDKQLNLPSDQLNMAKNYDEIINALMQKLLTKALQGGVSNLSGQNGYQSSFLTADQQQAATSAQNLQTKLQNDTSVSQQYGYVEQGAITDLQNTQSKFHSLVDCWSSIVSSFGTTSNQGSKAALSSNNAQSQIDLLQSEIDSYNVEITRANNSISVLERLQSRVLNASTLADVQSVQTDYSAAQANGSILSSNSLQTIQQNRNTLQSQLASLNQSAGDELNQCYSMGNPSSH